MARQLISYIVAFTLAWSGIAPAFAVQASKQHPGKGQLTATDSFSAVMDAFRSKIDRADFDLDVLIDRHAYDSEEILAFVRDEVRFEQYPGLLRGAQGALMSRAGNSLDQAVLLATLLKNNGEEARILRTRLSTTQVQQLLSRLNISRREKERLSPGRDQAGTAEPDAWELANIETVANTTKSIIAALDKEGISLGDSSVVEDILEEARDYFWVEYRVGPSETWISVHPVFTASPEGFKKLQFTETIGSNIAEDLQHRFRLQAFIEQKSGDRLVVHEIMDPWERPTANLANQSPGFSTLPSGLTLERLESGWDDILAQSRFFIPLLNGKPAPGGKIFDLNGNPFSLENMSMDAFGAAPLFQTVGGRAEKAAGAIGSIGSNPDVGTAENLVTLTALWLEYTLIEPGGRERTFRRMLLDRLGPAAREKSDFSAFRSTVEPRKLVTTTNLLVVGGEYPGVFLDEQFMKSMQFDHARSEYLASGANSRKKMRKRSAILDSHGWMLSQLALISATQRISWNTGPAVYRSAPGVMAVQYGLGDGDKIHGVVDIVTNPRRSIGMEKGVLKSFPKRILAQGIRETYVEGVALADLAGQPVQHVLYNADLSDASYAVISKSAQIAEYGWPEDVGERMRVDFERGYTLLVPVAHATDSGQKVAWWRIDPRAGETLGIDSEGRGGVIIERLVVASIGFLTVAVLVAGSLIAQTYFSCKKKHPGSSKALNCCMEKRGNSIKRTVTEGIGYKPWIDAVYAVERVRISSCEGRRLPAPTRPAK